MLGRVGVLFLLVDIKLLFITAQLQRDGRSIGREVFLFLVFPAVFGSEIQFLVLCKSDKNVNFSSASCEVF